MATVRRTLTEALRAPKAVVDQLVYCCREFETSMVSRQSQAVRLSDGVVMLCSVALKFCPFCGRPVEYEDTVIPPEGYAKL